MDNKYNQKFSSDNKDNFQEQEGFPLVPQVYPDQLTEKEIIAILDYPFMVEEAEGFNPPPTPPEDKPLWEQIITPWGMASLLLFLLANTLLSWFQGIESQKSPANLSQSSRLPLEVPEIPITESSQHLNSNNLSVVTPPITQPSVNTSSSEIIPQSSPSSHQGGENLTDALLPPSLQPQFIQSAPIPLAETPPQPSNPSTISVNQTLPVTPAVKPVLEKSSSPKTDTDKEKQAQLTRLRMLEQLRLSEEEKVPLGFNHTTRAKMQAGQSSQDPSLLINQLEKLQQEKLNISQ